MGLQATTRYILDEDMAIICEDHGEHLRTFEVRGSSRYSDWRSDPYRSQDAPRYFRAPVLSLLQWRKYLPVFVRLETVRLVEANRHCLQALATHCPRQLQEISIGHLCDGSQVGDGVDADAKADADAIIQLAQRHGRALRILCFPFHTLGTCAAVMEYCPLMEELDHYNPKGHTDFNQAKDNIWAQRSLIRRILSTAPMLRCLRGFSHEQCLELLAIKRVSVVQLCIQVLCRQLDSIYHFDLLEDPNDYTNNHNTPKSMFL